MFGAPEAHEDDPERAARAAFRALATDVPRDAAATLRIGLETGPAVLGPIGGGGRVEYGAIGEVVSLAATLQALARPGSALVGPVTRAAVGSLFTWGEPVTFGAERTATYPGRARPAGPASCGPAAAYAARWLQGRPNWRRSAPPCVRRCAVAARSCWYRCAGAGQDPADAGGPPARGPRDPVAGGAQRLLASSTPYGCTSSCWPTGRGSPGTRPRGDPARPGTGTRPGERARRPVSVPGSHDGPARRERPWAG